MSTDELNAGRGGGRGGDPAIGGGRVEILLVASCYRNQDKLRPDGPLGSYTDFTFTVHVDTSYTNAVNYIIEKFP